MPHTQIITTPDDLIPYTADLLTRSRHILLHGDLGAGKTTLVQTLSTHLDIDPTTVTSPTYGYLSIHEGIFNNKKTTLLHIDMYRLEEESSLIDKGILEQIDMADIVCIERPKWTHRYADSSWRVVTIRRDQIDDRRRVIEERAYTQIV